MNGSPLLSTPYVPPCVIVPDPNEDARKCNGKAGKHTILGFPLCDECYDAIRGEGLVVGPPVQVLGGVHVDVS